MYGIASEISNPAAFSVPALLPYSLSSLNTYKKITFRLTQHKFNSVLFLTPLNY